MLTRAASEGAFLQAVRACDPVVRVREALKREPVRGAAIIGIAVGKAALAMARGAGRVERGLVVAPVDDGRGLPEGWTLMVSSHPVPDARSVAAGTAAIALVGSAEPEDAVLALISGGASALIEVPRAGVTLDELIAQTSAAMRAGAPIRELNELRCQLSAIKGGMLAERSRAPVTTLVISDVIGDDATVIGSGPTVRSVDFAERVEVIAPMHAFGEAFASALGARLLEEPVANDVGAVAAAIAGEEGLVVAWGEPTVRVPDAHGEGGRAQQLALELARVLRGTERAAFAAGSDGIDGPTDAAGAFVDGSTWDAITRARIDPQRALDRCDAGTALAAVGALVITGPTGINHADVIAIG